MEAVFVDANYLIALLNPRDDLHGRVMTTMKVHGVRPWITTELVLVEVLNGLAGKGAAIRGAAVRLVEELKNTPRVKIVPHTTERFMSALNLYKQRQDKTWGLVDCESINTMQEHGTREALTYDLDFQQAGIRPLLRDTE